MVDLHTHIMGHMDRPTHECHVQAFLERAQAMGLREIGFSDHDYYESGFDFAVIRKTAENYPDLRVRVGIEFDYQPGQEQRIEAMLDRYDVDYAIGSVHELDGWAFNIMGQEDLFQQRSRDDLYRKYFGLVRQAAQSGLFQIIGHLDLIKLEGLRSEGDILTLAEEAIAAIRDADLCVEINTNGLNVPVREFYPETALIAELSAHGVAFTLGSDAHGADRVGENLDVAADILRGLDVRQVFGFARKERVGYSLGS